MQRLLKVMIRDLQGLWIARLAGDPLLVSGLLLPVWCVGARTRFLMTRCTIPTFVNVVAGNLLIRLNNHKGFHSIILHAVVDHEYHIWNINVGWPGRVHDARS